MTQSPIILVNNHLQTHVSVLDRGLSYGDGLFETMLMVNGDVKLWQYHCERLQRGLQCLNIILDKKRFMQHVRSTVQYASEQPAIFKLMVTRGEGGRGYAPAETCDATVISQITPISDSFIKENNKNQYDGIEAHYCRTYLSTHTALAGIKSLNQLPYVLASQERQNLTAQEGLMFTHEGQLIEATARNIFIVKEGELYTPLLHECGVAGVMRRVIMDNIAVSQKCAVHEVPLTKNDLLLADEIFLSNSVGGIWPVVACEDLTWSIGQQTRAIQHAIECFLEQEVSLSLSSFLSN